jgi:diaminopimelate decarboxylase
LPERAGAVIPHLFDARLLTELAGRFGTPLFAYCADTMRARMADLDRFDVVRFAQKANSNLAVLRLLRRAGAQVDAVSAGEIVRALRAGFEPSEIVLTADIFDRAALELVREHPVGLNLGSPGMLREAARARPGANVTLRVNPGFGHGHGPKVATGGEGSKHGIWHADLAGWTAHARELDLVVSGLHVHIGSGSDHEHLERAAAIVERCALDVGESLRTISAGGGLPIPYKSGEERFDVAAYARAWLAARDRIAAQLGHPIDLEVEPGRYLTGEAGVLLCEARGTKRSGSTDYILVDAGFHTLLRPAMYGAWHGISVVGKQSEPTRPQIVAGPLCESADVFTLEPRELPHVEPGDLLCIHDAGAYGASMSSNYNSQPLPAEVLVDAGRATLVRRRQTFDELLAPEAE